MTAAQRRAAVQQVMQIAAVSQRTACRFLGYGRSVIRYQKVRPARTVERERLRALAEQRTRMSYRFLHRLLLREDF